MKNFAKHIAIIGTGALIGIIMAMVIGAAVLGCAGTEQNQPPIAATWLRPPVPVGRHDDNVITVGDAGDQPTIALGIAAASSGDVVLVGAGTYTENITVGAGIIVQGVAPGGVTVTGNITIAATGSINWIHQTAGYALTQN